MNVYVDTSVTLRVLMGEPGQWAGWGKWTKAFSSRIWYTEALRAMDRTRLLGNINDQQVVQLRRNIDLVHGVFHIVQLTEHILSRAGESFPTIVGTLDAIHLATAIEMRNTMGVDIFLTHDAQLFAAAAASGFEVEGI